MSEITVYADQFAEIAAQVHGLDLVEQDVLVLAYFADGSVSVTVSDKDTEPIVVRADVSE